jgi:hypothetical protein
MAEKKKDASRLDLTKSQVKGSKARIKRNLGLDTSLLHGREFRKVMGCFPEHQYKVQTPGQSLSNAGKIEKLVDGVNFPEIRVR